MSEEWHGVILPAVLCAATLALLATRRLRADGVSVLALAAAVLLGVVSPDGALSGLADPVVVTVAALAILAGAVHRSGVIDLPRSGLARRFRLTAAVLAAAGLLVAVLAAATGRTGTRNAILRPQNGVPPRGAAMLNAACMLGGLMTLVGGVPNLLVSSVRRDLLGAPFGLLDFLPVGAILLGAGLAAFLATAAIGRRTGLVASAGPVDNLRRVKSFTSEVLLPNASPMAGRPVSVLEAAGEGGVRVLALVREGFRRLEPRPDWQLDGGDVLVLDCEPAVLQRLMERFGLVSAQGPIARPGSQAAAGIAEAVVTQSSELIGHPATAGLHARFGIHLLGIGRNDDHPPARLRRTPLRAGDILVLGGEIDAMPGVLAGLGCLLLAERRLRNGRGQQVALPICCLLLALLVAGLGLLPLWLALLAAVLVLVVSGVLSLGEAYETSPWPGLVMLAALLPLAEALHNSGLAANGMALAAPWAAGAGPATVAVAIGAGMAAAWAFGSAVAVLLVAPFAAGVALQAGLSADMLLVAVAVGASVDMLDGRGLVAALVPGGGHRVGAAWRQDAVAALLLLVVGTAAIAAVWRP